MVGFIILTIARIVLIGVIWLDWYLAKPLPFFIAFIATLVFLQQIAEHVAKRGPNRANPRD